MRFNKRQIEISDPHLFKPFLFLNLLLINMVTPLTDSPQRSYHLHGIVNASEQLALAKQRDIYICNIWGHFTNNG